MTGPVSIFWFRRDLRLHDNAGLFKTLNSPWPVVPIFIFDRNILEELEDKKDRRLEFILEALRKIHSRLIVSGSGMDIRYGDPLEIFSKLTTEYDVKEIGRAHV